MNAMMRVIDYGFSEADLDEIVSFETPCNIRSIRLMERLGFERDHQGDFDHPGVPSRNDLSRHVLYRKTRASNRMDPLSIENELGANQTDGEDS